MRCTTLRVVVSLVVCIHGGTTAEAQTGALDALVRDNSYAVQFDGRTLRGPGAELLFDLAGRSQFVALGEEHNTREIPLLTTALFLELQARHGYRYLAIEQDPISMAMASRPPLRGNAESIRALSDRYPHAFTFWLDEELEMLARIGAASEAKSAPIWGCDQAFGATHILDRLLEIGQAEDRAALRAFRDSAAAQEGERDLEKFHYMAQTDKSTEIEAARQALGAEPGSEAAFLLESMAISDRIYGLYREERYYRNNFEREQYMKARFIEEYERAGAAERSPARVILKFGHWHLYRGLGPSNIQTLGNFVSEVATLHGMESLHIAIFPNNEAGGYGDLSRWQDPTPSLLARTLPRAEWTLVDLRALRPHMWTIREEIPAEAASRMTRWVYGFDFALFIGGMQPGNRQ